jgi:hypothetical protein
MNFRKFFFVLIFLSLVAGCAGKPAETALPEAISTPEAKPTLDSSPTPEPSPTFAPVQRQLPPLPENRTHYKLDLILNYYSHFAAVTEVITYTNRSSQPLEAIHFVVPPRNFEDSYQQSDLRGGRVAGFTEDGIHTLVSLSSPLLPGETTTFAFNFRLVFPLHPGIYGYTNRQTNISDWYPFIPPYDEEQGWLAYDRVVDEDNIIVGESIVNEFSDFDVTLTLTDRAELIEVAASSPASGSDGKYSYHLEGARGFSFSVSDSYFEHEIVQDGIRIRSYVFMNNIETGIAVTQIGANAMKLYGELFYPYPHEMVSIVVGDFLHNMEMDGMVMISYGIFDFYNGMPQTDLVLMTSHELMHMWFYYTIGSNHALEPWLDEAFATYAELLYYQTYHPADVEWWWAIRIHEQNPQGFVDSTILLEGGYVPYRNAVYLRGVQFLNEVRLAVGEQAFFAALQDYAYSNIWRIATRQDFFDAMARHSQVDLTPIVSKYFEN